MSLRAITASSLALLLSACALVVGPGTAGPSVDAAAVDAGRTDAVADASSPVEAAVDGAADGSPCPPGTCIYAGSPACRPAGGGKSGCCRCGTDGTCAMVCVCAAPDTPVATPEGDRPIAQLGVGDRVYSVDRGRVAVVPIVRTRRQPVVGHHVVRVALDDGTVLAISAAHPTAEGAPFGDLAPGDWLGARVVASVATVPYAFDATYDILPGSDTGTYFAGGALIGSTLAHDAPAVPRELARACRLPPAGPRDARRP